MNKVYPAIIVLILFSLSGCIGRAAAQDNGTSVSPELQTEASVSPEILQGLKRIHPICFDLDTTEGLTVLAIPDYGWPRNGFRYHLISGSKKDYSLKEADEAAHYQNLSLEELEALLLYYGLPDESIHFRLYNPSLSSQAPKRGDDVLSRLSDTFGGRYEIYEEFFEVYHPEIDGTVADDSTLRVELYILTSSHLDGFHFWLWPAEKESMTLSEYNSLPPGIDLEEALHQIDEHQFSDVQIVIRPFHDAQVDYTWVSDDSMKQKMTAVFDNRFIVTSEFPVVQDSQNEETSGEAPKP